MQELEQELLNLSNLQVLILKSAGLHTPEAQEPLLILPLVPTSPVHQPVGFPLLHTCLVLERELMVHGNPSVLTSRQQ